MTGLTEIVLDCRHAAAQARFWAAALGWTVRPYDADEIARLAALGHTPQTDPMVAVDPPDGGPVLFCQEVPELTGGAQPPAKLTKNRLHLDVRLRDRAHLDELLDAGARVLTRGSQRWVLADPEDNEFCALVP